MTALSLSPSEISDHESLRPINLRTDLGQLADLIELVFADSMDSSGRAAIHEMRTMSRMGAGLSVISRLNELALGVGLGYVYEAAGRVVGNVSIYPANWPGQLGPAWIVANVGVHPDFQRRGIARRLMHASLNLIRQRGGRVAILQVDYDNQGAIDLYEQLGFVRERVFTTWYRLSFTPPPRQDEERDQVFITRRRNQEWQAEMNLVARLRPQDRGGIGWLKPLHVDYFQRPWLRRLADWLMLNGMERLVVRAEDDHTLRASLWLKAGMGLQRQRAFFFFDPADPAPGRALLDNLLRRYRATGIVVEHPADDDVTSDLLRRRQFSAQRTVWHMRLDLPTSGPASEFTI